MSSGIYTVLSGAKARMHSAEVITHNLSNINSNGFKKQRLNFASVLSDEVQESSSQGNNYTAVGEARIDFDQGVIADTGRDLDFAILGDAFFRVQRGDEFLYTRNGTFTRTADGTLVDQEGNQVLSADNKPIVIPQGNFEVDEKGVVLTAEGEAGQIPVFSIPVEALEHAGTGRFVFNGNLDEVIQAEDVQILQGSLERSNVNIMEEAALMMSNMRSFESYNKALKNYYELNGKVNDIGTL